MNSIFHDKLNEFIIIYIDDILVYSIGKGTCPTFEMSCKGSKLISFMLIEREALSLQG
jgi:hypothetical protein